MGNFISTIGTNTVGGSVPITLCNNMTLNFLKSDAGKCSLYNDYTSTWTTIYNHAQFIIMRYLLAQIIPQGCEINLETLSTSTCANQNIDKLKESNELPSHIDSLVKEGMWEKKQIHIVVVPTNSQRMLPYIDTHLEDIKMISMAFQEFATHRVRVYHIKKNDNILIVTNKLTSNMLRRALTIIPVIYKKEIPANIKEIFQAFSQTESSTDHEHNNKIFDHWATLIDCYIKNSDIIKIQYNKKLQECINNLYTQDTTTVERKLNAQNMKINDMLRQLQQMYMIQKDYELTLLGMKLRNTTELETELFDYLQKHKTITLIANDSNKLVLKINTAIEYFDIAAAEKYLDNSRLIERTSIKQQILKDIFVTQKYKLYTTTYATIDLKAISQGEYILNYTNEYATNTDYLHQPHIHGYNCWGNNTPHITKALINQDYITAFEQIVAATKNLNWTDSTVVAKCITWLTDSNYKTYKTIQDPTTGQFYSYIELYKQIDSERAQEAKAKAELQETKPISKFKKVDLEGTPAEGTPAEETPAIRMPQTPTIVERIQAEAEAETEVIAAERVPVRIVLDTDERGEPENATTIPNETPTRPGLFDR